MKMFTEQAKRFPVYAEVDVLVIGGGPAGNAAALAAARAGADTLLVERHAYLGGSVADSLQGMINGFRNPHRPNLVQTVRGIPQEIVLRLNRMNGLRPAPVQQDQFELPLGQLNYAYSADVEKLKVLLMQLMDESQCDVLLHTYATAAIVENGRINGAIIENKSGRQAILATTVIDCTGDADIAYRAGAICQNLPRSASAGSRPMMYKVNGFHIDAGAAMPGVMFNGSLVINGPSVSIHGITANDVSRGEIEARTRVLDHFEHLRQQYPGLKNAFVSETAPCLEFNRIRYIQGEYTLTERDALHGTRFPDVIAISSAPIQSYYPAPRHLEHEGFDIPYRCLLPLRVSGLIVAGPSISCEPQPSESIGASACLMAIGQAAGSAAALATARSILPRQVNAIELQQMLLKQGAELRRG